MRKNRLLDLFEIEIPIIQAGMVWCSGWKLVSQVSMNGGLGVIGSGSMYPDVLEYHIRKVKEVTSKPYAVNIPLLYPQIQDHIGIILKEKVPIVITSAGSPTKYTSLFKENNIKVIHVVSSLKFALKAQNAGVDAVVVEGFEAGGHNGSEENTTFCLVPYVKKHIHIPVIAAGGIVNGQGILGAFALGADGVQVGTRFAVAEESSAHLKFKKRILEIGEGDTELVLKKIGAARLIKNEFYQIIKNAEQNGASAEEIREILGKGRAKKGMFEGDLIEGELEIGQAAFMVDKIQPAAVILKELWQEYEQERTLFIERTTF